ncbi:MAG: hypothetical protein DLM73_03965 [Chthoniobacterales bacterium]|nr:MAG: hypothetical protein DLM73_03965 [Chthoniobacterales bacterium]
MPTITQISEDAKLRVDESACLWRYVKLSTLFLNLSGTVYLPTIAQLQQSDPKEGFSAVSAKWRFGYLLDHEPDTVKKIIEALPPDKQTLIGAGDPSNWGDMMQNSQIIADFYDEQQSKSKCAWCWHCSSHESAAMWKLYADSGVAIQTTLHRIASALPDVCFEAARIQYGNREPGQIDSFNPEAPGIRDILARAYLFKNNDYEFEKEIRFVTDASTPGCGRTVTNVSANQLIAQIVLSPWTELDEFEALQQQLRPLCPDAVITRSPLIKNLNDERTLRAMNRLMP